MTEEATREESTERTPGTRQLWETPQRLEASWTSSELASSGLCQDRLP